jgi:hypothetical protein
MTGSMEEQELKDRLSLIESMIFEGRRSTENWGWMFVYWVWPTTSPLPGRHGAIARWRGRSR